MSIVEGVAIELLADLDILIVVETMEVVVDLAANEKYITILTHYLSLLHSN